MKKYNYRIESIPFHQLTQDYLNHNWGQFGWELISVINTTDALILIFKKER
jgi:hypothetical protein